MTTFNKLDPSQVERLYYLSEELAESIQAIQKVLRHGYESYNPTIEDGPTNREHLQQELGQVLVAIELLVVSEDINGLALVEAAEEKVKNLQKWMHHQPNELLQKLKEGI